ncbi:acyl-CoA dehydrogenase family protein [Nocardia jiangxiensis]|uniref:Acyl-CoA dehydrogenase family protein n=1 Tax=Nocardia jiangxiensis TaxID=282685 RepID=A0ABW6S5W0_9NOCA|nr:acyl-CoA dehydrogenase family protein [Nocardia jiangxiensis]
MLPLSENPDPARIVPHDDLSRIGTDAAEVRTAPEQWDPRAFRAAVPGAHFDPALAGRSWRSSGDVVSNAPEYSRLSVNIAATHHDHRVGEQSRLVCGGHAIGIALAQATRALPNLVTMPGWQSCDHTGPVHKGDTLSSELTVEGARALGDTGGVLRLRSRAFSHDSASTDRQVLDWRFTAHRTTDLTGTTWHNHLYDFVLRVCRRGQPVINPPVVVADTEEQQSLVETIAQLLGRRWGSGSAHKLIQDPDRVSEVSLWSELADTGVAGLPIPESQGGSGGSWADFAVAAEALGAAVTPTPIVAVGGALGALSAPNVAGGELLAQIASGRAVPAVAWTEHTGMPGVAGQFEAVAGDRDARVLVSGTAESILTPEADVVLALADGESGPLLVAVATDQQAVRIERAQSLDLLRPLGTLNLQRAAGTVLATGDDAVTAIRHSLVTAGLALAGDLTGVAGHCLWAAVDYASTREQFGKPIGAFQAVKHKCADMLVHVELARATTREVAGLLDSGAPAAALDQAVALALLESITAAQHVTADYIQVLAGVGFTWEHEAHLYYRRAGAAAPLFGGVSAARERLDPTRDAAASTVAAEITPGSPAAELAAAVESLLPLHHEQWSADDSFPARLSWQQRLHQAGWIAPQWPQEFGGRGLSIVDQVACDQVLAGSRAPMLAGVLGVNNVAPTLMHYGTAEQREHLAAIQAGTEVWCQGFSEPGSGSDLASLRTRATLDGDEFVINGQKIWTSEGMEGTHCLLLVRTDPQAPPHKGISALLVPMDTPGITRRPITQITGEGGFAEVFFDDVRVPRSALLGPLHEGWKVTMTTLGFERAGVIMMAGRLEQTVLDLVNTLAGHDLPAHARAELTDRLSEARAVGLLGKRALGRIAAGGAPGAEHSVIKLVWSTTMQAIGDTHLRVLGPAAITSATGAAAQHDYLMSRSATIAGGTTEIMRNILAERVLGMPK